MRVSIFNALVGAAGLAAVASAAPALSSLDAVDTCVLSTTTVVITAKPSIVTVHEVLATTLYVHDPESSAAEIKAPKSTDPATAFDATIISTSVITMNAAPSTPADVISYYVTDGSTAYLHGQGLAPTDSIVYADQPVTLTVEPVGTTKDDSQQTSTFTFQSTISVTRHLTVTGRVSAIRSSFTGVGTGGWNGTSATYAPIYAGSTAAFVTGAMPHAGDMDKPSTTASTPLSAQVGFSVLPSAVDPDFIITAEPSINIYSSHSVTSLSTFSAKSGFYPNATGSPEQTSPSSFITVASTFATIVQINSTAGTFTKTPVSIATPTSQSVSPGAQLNQTSTVASSFAAPSASNCGEIGDYRLDFDDIPPLAIGNQDPNTVEPQPVFSPYRQFDFSAGWVVVPPPTDPYLPSSPPQLTEFIPNFNANRTTTSTGPNSRESGYAADIGNGDHDRTGCFRFNIYGASVGCDSKGPDCTFTFTGLRYDNVTAKTLPVALQTIAVPACPALANCSLTPIKLTTEFSDLTVIRTQVMVDGEPKIWWMDDILMGWHDNSCATGMCRLNTHIRKRQLAQK